MPNQRILVTGGAGFIGSALCERLVNQGHEVVAFDSLFRGSNENLAAIISAPNFNLITGDIRDISDLDECIEVLGEPDVIYHLAAVNGTKWFHDAAHSVIDVNINGTLRTLELAMAHDARYIFASSPEAFGESTMQPLSDGNPMVFTEPAVHQRHSYGASKYLGEIACQHAVREGLDVRIVRPFNAYGPRLCGDEYGQVIAIFFQKVLAKQPIAVHSDGSQTRSFTWIDDVVTGFLDAAAANVASGSTFNIGSTEEISIMDLALKIISISNHAEGIIHTQGYNGDSNRRLPDIANAQQQLGWQAEVTLDEGLRKMWFELNP